MSSLCRVTHRCWVQKCLPGISYSDYCHIFRACMSEVFVTSYTVICTYIYIYIYIPGTFGRCFHFWRAVYGVFKLTSTLHSLIIIIIKTYLETLNFSNACQVYAVGCVAKINQIFWIIFYSIYETLCFQLSQFSCGENMYFILSSLSNQKYRPLIII